MEANEEAVRVDILSTEIIKPNSPTPSHLRNITFSFLDQTHYPIAVPSLLFFSAPLGATPLDVTLLKTCLSRTLSYFYPLAGRYETWGTTVCNDQGVPFVEARVNCSLVDALTSLSSFSNIDLCRFYPPMDKLISSGIHVAIQINVFTCGGFALGWYHTHKVTDGVSASTFFKHWAALVTKRYEEATQHIPNFKAGAIAFPPIPTVDRPVMASTLDYNKQDTKNILAEKRFLVKSFVFNNFAVAQLQAKSKREKVRNPSRFLALTGFLWQQIVLASPHSNKVGKSIIRLPVDLRPRCEPVLPRGSIGNLVEMAVARARKEAPLQELVAAIHESISNMKDIVVEYQGEKRAEAKEKHRRISMNAETKYDDFYVFSAWCKSAGFSNLDFGLGKPDWIVPIDDKSSRVYKNFVLLADFKENNNEDGFEAWLFLEEEHLTSLESSPDLLAFASPRF